MKHINAGVWVGGMRPASKTAVQRAIAAGEDIRFDVTSAFNTGPVFYRLSEIPEGTVLDIVGPDPYTKRSWYGTATSKGVK